MNFNACMLVVLGGGNMKFMAGSAPRSSHLSGSVMFESGSDMNGREAAAFAAVGAFANSAAASETVPKSMSSADMMAASLAGGKEDETHSRGGARLLVDSEEGASREEEFDQSGRQSEGKFSFDVLADENIDITAIPTQLDANFDFYGGGAALRSAVINPSSSSWSRQRKATLLSTVEDQQLFAQQIDSEKNNAIQLLDALTRSGAIAISNAEIHVVIAVTHCFTNTLMDSLVVDNINPVEEIERGVLIAASTLYRLDFY